MIDHTFLHVRMQQAMRKDTYCDWHSFGELLADMSDARERDPTEETIFEAMYLRALSAFCLLRAESCLKRHGRQYALSDFELYGSALSDDELCFARRMAA